MSIPQYQFTRSSQNTYDTSDPSITVVPPALPVGTLYGTTNGARVLATSADTICKITITDGRGAGVILVNAATMTYGYPGYFSYPDTPAHAAPGAILLVSIAKYDATGTTLQYSTDAEFYDGG